MGRRGEVSVSWLPSTFTCKRIYFLLIETSPIRRVPQYLGSLGVLYWERTCGLMMILDFGWFVSFSCEISKLFAEESVQWGSTRKKVQRLPVSQR